MQDDLQGLQTVQVACSAMRSAVREMTSVDMALGWRSQPSSLPHRPSWSQARSQRLWTLTTN